MRKLGSSALWALACLLFFVPMALASPADLRLREAIEHGDAEAVRVAIRGGANPNAEIETKSFDGSIFRRPAVIYAVRSVDQYPDVVIALIEGGADVEAVMPVESRLTKAHFSLLLLTFPRMHVETDPLKMEGMMRAFSAIVEGGADVNWPNDMNPDEGEPYVETFYPIHDAVMIPLQEYAIRACALLFDHGADVNQRTFPLSGITPLMFASAHIYPSPEPDRSPLVRFLVERGADVNAATAEGSSVLHIAAESASAQTVRTLIELGAWTTTRDDQGRTPFGAAMTHGEVESALVIYQYEKSLRQEREKTID